MRRGDESKGLLGLVIFTKPSLSELAIRAQASESETKKKHAEHRANRLPCPERERPYVGSFSQTARWTMGKQTVFTSFTSFALS